MDEVYDKTIKPGDLVTAYSKGFHRVTAVKPRPHNTPIIATVAVLTSAYKKAPAKKAECDAAYCRKTSIAGIKQMIRDEISELERASDALDELLK